MGEFQCLFSVAYFVMNFGGFCLFVFLYLGVISKSIILRRIWESLDDLLMHCLILALKLSCLSLIQCFISGPLSCVCMNFLLRSI